MFRGKKLEVPGVLLLKIAFNLPAVLRLYQKSRGSGFQEGIGFQHTHELFVSIQVYISCNIHLPMVCRHNQQGVLHSFQKVLDSPGNLPHDLPGLGTGYPLLVHDGVRLRAIAVDKTRARLPAAFLQGLPEFPQGTESPVSFSVCYGDIVRKNRVNVPLRLTLIKVIRPLVYGVILGTHPLLGHRIPAEEDVHILSQLGKMKTPAEPAMLQRQPVGHQGAGCVGGGRGKSGGENLHGVFPQQIIFPQPPLHGINSQPIKAKVDHILIIPGKSLLQNRQHRVLIGSMEKLR